MCRGGGEFTIDVCSGSHFGVACTIEKRLAPCVTQALVKLCCLDRVINICILMFAIDGATVGHLLVCELEEVAIEDLLAVFFENFQKCGLIVRVHILVELSEGEEVFPVNTMVSRVS